MKAIRFLLYWGCVAFLWKLLYVATVTGMDKRIVADGFKETEQLANRMAAIFVILIFARVFRAAIHTTLLRNWKTYHGWAVDACTEECLKRIALHKVDPQVVVDQISTISRSENIHEKYKGIFGDLY